MYSLLPNCFASSRNFRSIGSSPKVFPLEEVQSGGAESSDRTDPFMICDYFGVPGAHDTVLDFADLFTITHRNNGVQEFATRWDEFPLVETDPT